MTDMEKHLLLIGGFDPHGVRHNVICDVYSRQGKRQRKLVVPDVPAYTRESCAITIGNDVYVTGAGGDGDTAGAGLYRLTTKTLRWQRLKDMAEGRKWHTAAGTSSHVVVFCGEETDTVEIYDILKDEWRYSKKYSNGKLWKAASCAFGDAFMVSGGQLQINENYTGTKAVWKLSIGKNQSEDIWDEMCPLNAERYHHNMVELNGSLFVLGGYNLSIEVWKPGSESFTMLPVQLPLFKVRSPVVVHGSDIILGPGMIQSDEDAQQWFDKAKAVSSGKTPPAGGWADDSLVTMSLPHTITVDMMPLHRRYLHGSHAALLHIPADAPDTLLTFIYKMRDQPAQLSSQEIEDAIAHLADILSSHDYSLYREGNLNYDLHRAITTLFQCVFIGVSFDLCVKVLDTVLAFFGKNGHANCCSETAGLLVNKYHIEIIATTSSDKYLRLLKHLALQGATLQPKVLDLLVEPLKDGKVPFQQVLAVDRRIYFTLLRTVISMIKESDLNRLSKMLNEVVTLSDFDHMDHFFLENAGFRPGMKNLMTQKLSSYQGCHMEWKEEKLQCSNTHTNCPNADYKYFKKMHRISPNDLEQAFFVDFIHEGQPDIATQIKSFFNALSTEMKRICRSLAFSVEVAGSVSECTKIGRYDEFDIQLKLDINSAITDVVIAFTGNADIWLQDGALQDYTNDGVVNPTVFGEALCEYLRQCILAVEWKELPFSIKTTSHPWVLVWNTGTCCGMRIYIDIVPVVTLPLDTLVRVKFDNVNYNDYSPDRALKRQGVLLENPVPEPLKLHLKWGKPAGKHRFCCTLASFEKRIMLQVPQQVRSSSKLIKWLLEVEYWRYGAYYSNQDKLITSYMVKNALFWVLTKEDVCQNIDSTPSEPVCQNIDSTSPESLLQTIKWSIRILDYLLKESQEGGTLKSFFISNIFLYQNCYMKGIEDMSHKLLEFLHSSPCLL